MGTIIFPSIGPSLQIPIPTQPYNDPRYHHLLESRGYPQPPRLSSPSSSSSNPSPSSTLYSSDSGATLVLDEEVAHIKKVLWPSASPSLDASSSTGPSPTSQGPSKKVGYQSWMLNPGSAFYAPLFSPIDLEPDSESEEDEMKNPNPTFPSVREQTQIPIPPSPSPLPSPIQRPPKRQRTAPYRHVHPRTPWSEFFQRGCRSRNRDTMRFYARMIVSSQRWDDDDDIILSLVQTFVRHAVDTDVEAQERENVAWFASRVGMAFASIVRCPNKCLGSRFRALMRETVLETFISCWHLAPENPDAITHILCHNPSPSYLSYVLSALHLCSFIGDLYAEKLLSRADTVGCIRIIFHNLSLVEHITAVGNILKRAGSALWKEACFQFGGISNLTREVSEFEVQMQRAMCVVQDHHYLFAASRADEPPGKRSAPLIGVVKRKVLSLVAFVKECKRFAIEGRAADGLLVAISPER